MKKVKAYVYVPEAYWDRGKRKSIIESFSKFEVEHSRKATIGAGADGLLPSFDVLIVISVALGAAVVGQIAGGFLNAIGKDTWDALKKSLKKAKQVKPDSIDPSIPREMNVPHESEIIWWVHFDNAAFLIHLPGLEDWDEAFESLPYVAEKTFRENPNASRLIWGEGKWKSF